MKHVFTKEPSSFSIFINLVLLLAAIFSYVFVDRYLTATANQKIENIEKKSEGQISDKDAETIANEKYLMALATLTTLRGDIDKLYNQIETTDVSLTDDNLINALNEFKASTFVKDGTVSEIANYNESIEDNFTDDFIAKNIIYPNGFIGAIDNNYYIIKSKVDNVLFKEVSLKLVSKTDSDMAFKIKNINYDPKCINQTATIPIVTCNDTKESDTFDFKLIKEDNKWKVSAMTLPSQNNIN